MPFLMYQIFSIFTVTTNTLQYDKFDLPKLPSSKSLGLNDFVYFSYAPDNEQNKKFIQTILEENNLKEKIKSFKTIEEANKYIVMKNIHGIGKKHFQNVDYYKDQICKDIYDYYYINSTLYPCHFDVALDYRENMRKQYQLTDEELKIDVENNESYKDQIIFHINFYTSEELINNKIPQNITHEVVYNASCLEKTLSIHPDKLSKKFKNTYVPFWTGYGLQLQQSINQALLKQYTNVNLDYTYKRFPNKRGIEIYSMLFFQLTNFFSISVMIVCGTVIALYNKGKNQLILRRLGVKEYQFFILNSIFLLLYCEISCVLCGYIFWLKGILPFSTATLRYSIVIWMLIGFGITYLCMFLTQFLGKNHSFTIIMSCIASIVLLVLGIIHYAVFQCRTMFDPSLVPQWFLWFLTVFLPGFNIMMIYDSISGIVPEIIKTISMSSYRWETFIKLTDINYLTENLNGYASDLRYCLNSLSPNGITINGYCYYYIPLAIKVVGISIGQYLLLAPLSLLASQYFFNDLGFRGINIFKKMFTKKDKKQKIIESEQSDEYNIEIKNLRVRFIQLQNKCKPKSKQKNRDEIINNQNFAIKEITHIQKQGQISAVIGESGVGKSTFLRFLAGELQPSTKYKKSNKKQQIKTNDDYEAIESQLEIPQNDDNQYKLKFNKLDKKERIQYLQQFENGEFKIANRDYNDPNEVYKLKPFIGYLPQDFSNVWMGLNCYQNVYYSYLLRMDNSKQKIGKKQETVTYIKSILTDLGLGDEKVLKRKASQLSGGMLRRLSLCNAIVANPKILLLDEVSAGVDPVVKRSIWKAIQKSHAKTILLTTHDTTEIQEMATNITILDNGFSLTNNESIFDLRNKSKTQKLQISFVNSENIIQLRQSLNNLQTEQIKITNISPHQVTFAIIGLEFNDIEQFISQIKQHIKQEINITLAQCSLDEIYQHICQIEQQNENNDDEIQVQNIKVKKFPLFIKNFQFDFYFKFPTIVTILIVALVVLIIAGMVGDILNQVFASLFKNAKQKSRQQPFYNCFQQCRQRYNSNRRYPYNYLDIMQKCLANRDPQIFDNLDASSYQQKTCYDYFSYLGFDIPTPQFISIGDRRLQTSENTQLTASFNVIQPRTHVKNDILSVLQTDNYFNINYQKQSIQVTGLDNNAFRDIYSRNKFDPTINKSDDVGFTAFLSHKYSIQGQDSNYTINRRCITYASNIAWQMRNCGRNPDQNKITKNCLSYFDNPKNKTYSQRELILYSANVLTNVKENSLLDMYKLAIQNGQAKQSFIQSIGIEQIKQYKEAYKHLPLANINITEYNSNNEKLNIKLDATTYLPNRGSLNTYKQEYINVGQSSNFYYNCYQDEISYNTYYNQFQLPTTQKNKIYSINSQTQSQPDHARIVLFDVANEPFTLITSALIRKELFKSSAKYDYSAWNFSLSLVNRAMPEFDKEQDSDSSFSFIALFVNIAVSIVGIFPILYSVQLVATELEQGLNNVLQIHGISQLKQILSWLLYLFIVTVTISTITIVFAFIFTAEMMNKNLADIGILYLQGFSSICTGLMLSYLIKKAKPCIVISFIILMMNIFFVLLMIKSDMLAYIEAVIVPSMALTQIYLYIQNEEDIPLGVLAVVIVSALLQLSIAIILANYHQIYNFFASKKIISSEEHLVENDQLQIENVTFCYGKSDVKALNNVSFQISQNQVFGLLGANGSGKSTLIHCLCNFLHPKGKAIFDNANLFQSDSSKYISLVSQKDILWPNLTVKNHLELFSSIHSHSNNYEFIQSLLQKLNLYQFFDQKIQQLSDGVKRKLSIAIGLIQQPKFLILDEPSCGLGIKTKQIVHQTILNICQDQTIIITTHDMDEVEKLIDRCVIMKNGEIVAQGEINQFINQSNYQLTVDTTEENIEIIAQKFNVLSKKLNETTNLTEMEISSQGIQQIEVVKFINSLGVDVIVDQARMEKVFMDFCQ